MIKYFTVVNHTKISPDLFPDDIREMFNKYGIVPPCPFLYEEPHARSERVLVDYFDRLEDAIAYCDKYNLRSSYVVCKDDDYKPVVLAESRFIIPMECYVEDDGVVCYDDADLIYKDGNILYICPWEHTLVAVSASDGIYCDVLPPQWTESDLRSLMCRWHTDNAHPQTFNLYRSSPHDKTSDSPFGKGWIKTDTDYSYLPNP